MTNYHPSASYDELGDVLYVSLFKPPRPAVCRDIPMQVLVRFDHGELVGVTIVDFAAQAIEAQRAETVKQGSVHESAVPEGNAP